MDAGNAPQLPQSLEQLARQTGKGQARRCQNCTAPLFGRYCYHCGQEDRDDTQTIGGFIRHALAEAFSFDSKFFRSVKPLLFRPGFLTKEYFLGHRARYIPPLRVYVVSSLLMFLVVGLLPNPGELVGDDFTINGGRNRRDSTQTDSTRAANKAKQKKGVTQVQLMPGVQFSVDGDDPKHALADSIKAAVKPDSLGELKRQRSKKATNDVFENLSARLNEKSKGMKLKDLYQQTLDRMPTTLFILVPVFALLLWLFHIGSRRDYLQHLLLSVHLHSFLFVFITLMLLANYAINQFSQEWELGIVLIYPLIYFPLALRNFYGNKWFWVLAKSFWLGFSYAILLTLGASGAAIWGILRS